MPGVCGVWDDGQRGGRADPEDWPTIGMGMKRGELRAHTHADRCGIGDGVWMFAAVEIAALEFVGQAASARGVASCDWGNWQPPRDSVDRSKVQKQHSHFTPTRLAL